MATVPGYCPGFGRACFWPAASRDDSSGLLSRFRPRLLLTRSKPRQKIRANVPTYAAPEPGPQQAAATVRAIIVLCAASGGGMEISMKKEDLILVIDMQNVYLSGQKWACLNTEGAAQNILKVLDAAGNRDVPALFTKFMPPQDPFGRWKTYNETYRDINENEWLNEMVESLQKISGNYPVFEKSVYSSLKVPEIKKAALETTARGGRVVLTGVVAECCVLSTAFDAIDLGCEFIYVTDAVSGFDRPRENASILMLSGLSPLHGKIMDTGSYLKET